jgi:predicted alpha/beta superfamily hydrolase
MKNIELEQVSTPTHSNKKIEQIILSFKLDNIQNENKIFNKLKKALTKKTLKDLKDHLSNRVNFLENSLEKHGDHQPYRMVAAIKNLSELRDRVELLDATDLVFKKKIRAS